MHAFNAAALFYPANKDEEILNDKDAGECEDEQGVDGWDSRGGSPANEREILVCFIIIKGILSLIQLQWEASPSLSHAHDMSTKKPIILLSPVPSIWRFGRVTSWLDRSRY